VPQGRHAVSGPGLRGEVYTAVTHEKEGPVVSITAELSTTARTVLPAEMKEYAKVLNELDGASSVRIRLASRLAPAAASFGNGEGLKPGYLGLVFLGLLLGLWFGAPAMARKLDGFRARRFHRRTQTAPGESASTALRATTAEDLRRQIQARECSCGRKLFQVPLEAGDSSLVGARTVHCVRARCACGVVTPTFFVES
jgi:hypothetical protein